MEMRKSVETLIALVNEMLSILEEIYTQSDKEEDRKQVVELTSRNKGVLNELLRVERLLDLGEMNDIEAAQNRKLMKVWHKELTKRKMHLEAGLHYIQSTKQ